MAQRNTINLVNKLPTLIFIFQGGSEPKIFLFYIIALDCSALDHLATSPPYRLIQTLYLKGFDTSNEEGMY